MRALAVRFGAPLLTLFLAACDAGGGPGGERPEAGSADPPAAVAQADRPDPAPSTDPYASCWEGPEPGDCARRVEQQLMERAGTAHRSGDTLWIQGRDGSRLPLANRSGDEFPMYYRYAGYYPDIGMHGAWLAREEQSEFVLVDAATTNMTHVLGPPVASPEGTRFATASLDLIAGHNVNGLQVWRWAPVPSVEWELRGGSSWGASDLVWVSDDVLEFELHRPRPPEYATTHAERMRLTLRSDGLELTPTR